MAIYLNDDKPYFSIIIATLNAEKYLEQCILSIIGQTEDSFELIIVDGVSTDKTLDIINKYKKYLSYFESSKDYGIYDAWNKALRHLKGEWVYFLGADDYLCSNKVLAKVRNSILLKQNNLQFLIAYGEVISIDDIKNYTFKNNYLNWNKLRPKFLQMNYLHHQGVFHNKKYFEKYGYFDDSFKIAGDYELLLRGLKNNSPYELKIEIANARLRGLSTNWRNTKKTLLEFRLAKIKNNIKYFGFLWHWCYFKLIIKSVISLIFGNKLTEKIIDYYRST